MCLADSPSRREVAVHLIHVYAVSWQVYKRLQGVNAASLLE